MKNFSYGNFCGIKSTRNLKSFNSSKIHQHFSNTATLSILQYPNITSHFIILSDLFLAKFHHQLHHYRVDYIINCILLFPSNANKPWNPIPYTKSEHEIIIKAKYAVNCHRSQSNRKKSHIRFIWIINSCILIRIRDDDVIFNVHMLIAYNIVLYFFYEVLDNC